MESGASAARQSLQGNRAEVLRSMKFRVETQLLRCASGALLLPSLTPPLLVL
jgi:hypothetical protein